MEVPIGSSWIYVGYESGRVAVYGGAHQHKSPYLTPNHGSWSSAVISLRTHPLNDDLLLIAHADGSIVLWSLGASALQERFTTVNFGQIVPACTDPVYLQDAQWKPDGEEFVTGTRLDP
ncbi:hypothetical protein RI367_003695 [Sorochytrium milnesiophthora]